MTPFETWTSFYTIVRKDLIRIMRIWPQTFLPSVVTSVLYFLIFGSFLGDRLGAFGNIPYVNFVIPGLVMLGVVTNAFSNVATVFFASKFFARNIDELLVSPTPPTVMVAGFVFSGVVRGVLVGLLVLLVSLAFADLRIYNPAVVVVFLLLTSLGLSLAGLINGIYAKSFDGITIIPTFVLAPLVYLGGVFYSADILPAFWRVLTYLNPIYYIINGFRYGFLGITDVPIWICSGVMLASIAALAAVNWWLLKTGLGLRQ
ncbi:MAG: ABC transporter permease [Bauldia sp.]